MGLETVEERRVRRRTVFYVEGYDPRGPSHYHALYRDEAAKQSAVNGLAITVGPRRRPDAISAAWSVTTPVTETDYVFLRYDDLMRARWSRTNLGVFTDFMRYGWAFLRRGVYANMVRHSWPICIFMSLAPALVVIAALLSVIAAAVAGTLTHWMAGVVLFPVVMAALVMLRPWLEPRMDAFWLGRIGIFTAELGAGKTPAMEERIDAFGARIAAEAIKGDAEEILVIGHSVGSFIGISAVARALRQLDGWHGEIAVMTVGHAIPILGVQPGAQTLRDELRAVASEPRVTWLDFSAASDVLCYVATDPLEACGLEQPDPQTPKPRLMSPRYPKLFRPATYKAMKRDFYRHHFQYLMAAELPGDYDYFLITAGDLTLAQRFADRPGIAKDGRLGKKGA